MRRWDFRPNGARRLLSVACLLLVAGVSQAATKTWTGAVNSLWSVGGNWVGGVPVAGDALVFPQVASNTAMTNDLAAGTIFGSLAFPGSTAYTLSGNAIGISGGITNVGTVVFNVDIQIAGSPMIANSAELDLAGTLDVNGNVLTLNSNFTRMIGPIVGTGELVEVGSILALEGASSFTGLVTFKGQDLSGNLVITGSLPNASVVEVSGLLTGVGPIGSLTANDIISPGSLSQSAGILSTGSMALNASSTYAVDIKGAAAGTGYDQLHVTGTVSLGGGHLVLTVATAVAVGQTFVIIDNDGADPVVGTLAGLPEGSTLTAGGVTFRISYQGGSGNDVVLTVVQPAVASVATLGNAGLIALASLLVLAALWATRRVGG